MLETAGWPDNIACVWNHWTNLQPVRWLIALHNQSLGCYY